LKQVLQNLKTGAVTVTDVPIPMVRPGFVLVRTVVSLISAGTERTAVEAGQKSLIGRAMDQPALVKKVIDRATHEGIANTVGAVRAKLASNVALGYSASGVVIGTGDGVTQFREGDRVACAGLGYASHAEVLAVPKNLCVAIPEGVSFEAAAFGTVGAIALQGVRLAEPTLGESVVVIGCGLIGQLTVQLLKANGCRVFGIDPAQSKVDLARQSGADDASATYDRAKERVLEWTRRRGADAVIITAGTDSNQPIELAGDLSRSKGRVVAVGAVGLNIPRQTFYDRELTFRVSKSYGPGRYDPQYEERGHDYPFAYVRWTEGRNIEAFLDLLAGGGVDVEPLITHRFDLSRTEEAYQLITGEIEEPHIGVLLTYDTERAVERRVSLATKTTAPAEGVRVGMIGAGGYAKGVLLPQFKSAGAEFQSITTASGVTAREVGMQYGFRAAVSSADEVIDDSSTNLIVIATRHRTHAELAQRALAAGKHVFVEKPLALDDQELDHVLAAAGDSSGRLMVGFNRRFSPLAIAVKDFFDGRTTPLTISYRINTVRAPADHWTSDLVEGGGPIRGEVCHFIDFLHYVTGSLTERVFAESLSNAKSDLSNEDSIVVAMRLGDGSNASIVYSKEGDRSLPKERIEIFGGGKALVIDDFRTLTAYDGGKEKITKLRKQDKGQTDQVREVCEVVRNGKPAPITLEDLATTTRATFRIRESLRTGLPIEV
jgi:predicted dehydrogenase/threonine dehydrogenase-like Zn-dependent dehydrogenase